MPGVTDREVILQERARNAERHNVIERADELRAVASRFKAREQAVEQVVKALEEAEEVLALSEAVRMKDPAHHEEVRQLGERIGYGALMSTASRAWHDKAIEIGVAGSEYTCGACHATVLQSLAMIHKALAAYKASREVA